jgi:hypothetical protein
MSSVVPADKTNAREVYTLRCMLCAKTGNIAELKKLSCITIRDIPKDMTIFEFDSIMSYLIGNNIPPSEYANVLKTGL